MRRGSIAVSFVAVAHFIALTAPRVAWAQSATGDEPNAPPAAPPSHSTTATGDAIYLKNGGILRGTIVDAIPNAQARIQLVTGEIATVPWQDINRIEHANAAPTTPSTASPAAVKPSVRASVVRVHIDGPDEARLQQDRTGDDDWTTVCTSPCDKALPTAYYYRIVGDGIKASSEFVLHAQAGESETIHVSAGSKGWFATGIVAMVIGGVVGYIGLIVAAAEVTAADLVGGTTGNHAEAGAWTATLVGGGVMVGGLILMLSNVKTSTTQELEGRSSDTSAGAWTRTPTWRDASPEQKALPPSVGATLFSGHF